MKNEDILDLQLQNLSKGLPDGHYSKHENLGRRPPVCTFWELQDIDHHSILIANPFLIG